VVLAREKRMVWVLNAERRRRLSCATACRRLTADVIERSLLPVQSRFFVVSWALWTTVR